MSDLIREIEDWLADDTPRRLEALVEAATPVERPVRSFSADWRERVIIYRHEAPPANIGELFTTPRTTIRRIHDSAPEDLRWIAAQHRQALKRLQDDIALLESAADALEAEDELGVRLAVGMDAIRGDREDQKARRDHAYRTASQADGVLSWEALDHATAFKLYNADLLTIDEVREALLSGDLHDVDGIGPARFRKIAAALKAEDQG